MIREATIADAIEIEKIGKSYTSNFTDSNFIVKDLIENPFSKYVVYIDNANIIGFTNYLIKYDKAEIVNIVVKEDNRNKSIGTMMMQYVIDVAIKSGCENITLEVRKSNLSAIKLYKKFNFKEVAIRKQYYDNEDGILMEKKLVI